MTATTTIPAFLSEFRDLLIARPGLLDVNVFTGDMPDDRDAGPESIQLIHIEQVIDPESLGNCRRMEVYTLTGLINIVRAGAGEEVIEEARDRAFAVYREVELQLLETKHLGGAHITARLRKTTTAGVASMNGRTCWIEFEIEIQSQLTRT